MNLWRGESNGLICTRIEKPHIWMMVTLWDQSLLPTPPSVCWGRDRTCLCRELHGMKKTQPWPEVIVMKTAKKVILEMDTHKSEFSTSLWQILHEFVDVHKESNCCHIFHDKVIHLKDFCHLFTDKSTDVPREGKDDNDEVVHGSTDGKSLRMVVEAVASRKINHVHLLKNIWNIHCAICVCFTPCWWSCAWPARQCVQKGLCCREDPTPCSAVLSFLSPAGLPILKKIINVQATILIQHLWNTLWRGCSEFCGRPQCRQSFEVCSLCFLPCSSQFRYHGSFRSHAP